MLSETMRVDLAKLHRCEARGARLRGDMGEALRLSAMGAAIERNAFGPTLNHPSPPRPAIPWGPPVPLPPPPTPPAPCGPCGPKVTS